MDVVCGQEYRNVKADTGGDAADEILKRIAGSIENGDGGELTLEVREVKEED